VSTRPHTGRRRNEAARQAILEATRRLLRERGAEGLTIDAIAREARVSRQTIYRWWPSRAAIVVEASARTAELVVPAEPSTGSLRGDLRTFLAASYEAAARADIAPVLRALAGEALRDESFAEGLREFTSERRAALRALLERHGVEAQRAALVADLAYGMLWYRLVVGHAPLDARAGEETADLLVDAIAR
jgi:AcrR family transcriptional regulator